MKKICTNCNIEKEPEEYYKAKGCRDGIRPECKQCVLNKQKAYIELNKDKSTAADKIYYEKNKEQKLKEHREYYKIWLAAQDMDEFKAKQRETQRTYHTKKKELKRLKLQELAATDEDNVAIYVEVFDELLKQ